jgi:hypothetical protein
MYAYVLRDGMRRPKVRRNSERLSLRLDAETLTILERERSRLSIPLSPLVRMIIREWWRARVAAQVRERG